MPHQNRVDPMGSFHAVTSRGALMGNRGILHDAEKRIGKTHVHQNWIICVLEFKGRKRELMAEGCYTELFFLDEATALAAGHRPCAECQRTRYRNFSEIWQRLHGPAMEGRTLAQTIDRELHAARIARGGVQVIFEANAAELPTGTMISVNGQPVLLWEGAQFEWSFEGYERRAVPVTGRVRVLTPRPLVDVLGEGFIPEVHPSVLIG